MHTSVQYAKILKGIESGILSALTFRGAAGNFPSRARSVHRHHDRQRSRRTLRALPLPSFDSKICDPSKCRSWCPRSKKHAAGNHTHHARLVQISNARFLNDNVGHVHSFCTCLSPIRRIQTYSTCLPLPHMIVARYLTLGCNLFSFVEKLQGLAFRGNSSLQQLSQIAVADNAGEKWDSCMYTYCRNDVFVHRIRMTIQPLH